MLKNYSLIYDPNLVSRNLSRMDRSPLVAIDLETTGLNFMKNEIHGVSVANESMEFYFTHDAVPAVLSLLSEFSRGKKILMHNGVFDLHFLRKGGVEIETMWDTMIAQFLVNENQRLGLKELAHTQLGIADELPDFNDLRQWSKKVLGKQKLDDITVYDMPIHILAEYAARDTRLTYDLWQVTEPQLAQEGMTGQFFGVEMPFLRVLLDMEENGFFIDVDKLKTAEAEFMEKRDEALERFAAIAGEVNINSDKQLAEYFYGTLGYRATRFTEKDAPSVDIVSLNRLKANDKNGAVAAVLDFRKYEKLISTYTVPFYERIVNGHLYGSFNQAGTVTGRLSSSGPNLQNIPARGETGSQVREFFAAPEGFKFLDIDYSQLELRLLAHYTKDKNLLKVFAENGDPHQMTVDLLASMGFTIQRRDAKTVNFGWAYGVGPKGLADQIEKASSQRPKESDTKAWLRGFEKAYPGAPRWKFAVIDYARELGYVKTVAGRKRRLPDLKETDNSLRGAAERMAVNAIIQGSASDIIKWAMLEIYRFQEDYGAKMLAQVHDELCWQVPDETVAEFGQRASGLMVEGGRNFKLRVDLIAEPGIGQNWSEAK